MTAPFTPAPLRARIDPMPMHTHRFVEEYDGLVGFGLDRLAMIMSGTPDIRYFTQNDQRFLAQFAAQFAHDRAKGAVESLSR